jgi:hypothetical protein
VPASPRRAIADSAAPVGQGGAPLVRFPAEVPAPELWIAWRVPGFLDGTSSTTDLWTALLIQNVKASHLADPDVATVRCSEDPGCTGP